MSDYLAYLRRISTAKTFRRKAGYFRHNFGPFLRFPDPARAAVLEIGPGLGEFVAFLNGRGVRAIDVVDNDPAVLAHVSASFAVRQAHRADEVPALDAALGQYDAIVMTQVLEHLDRPAYVPWLRTLYRHLRPGGVLLVTVPNGANPLNAYERYSDVTHRTVFSDNALAQLAHQCGFPAAGVAVQGYRIPPAHPVNILRILLQKALHGLIRGLLLLNGSDAPALLTPSITLVVRKTPDPVDTEAARA